MIVMKKIIQVIYFNEKEPQAGGLALYNDGTVRELDYFDRKSKKQLSIDKINTNEALNDNINTTY
jgi:hypothetical protein|nr:MAG TPA: hypothetical protein [Caudoviricetes sp.]